MMTVAQALESFISGLELSDKESAAASNQQTYLRTQLQQRLRVEDVFLSGSYARNTAIRPLNDIDVFLVLNRAAHMNLRSGRPGDTLGLIQRTLAEIYVNKAPARLQARSVNIEFTGTGIAYDVVPAFLDASNAGVYEIPDVTGGCWVRTNPKIHREKSTASNERAGKKLKPLVKAAKHWNARSGKPMRSFHLEVLAGRVLNQDPGSYLEGLTQLFAGLRDAVLSPCPEPAGLGPNLEEGAPDRFVARQKLAEAADTLTEAKRAAEDGKAGLAHGLLHGLFGPEYPEEGDTTSWQPTLALGQAVDSATKRFG